MSSNPCLAKYSASSSVDTVIPNRFEAVANSATAADLAVFRCGLIVTPVSSARASIRRTFASSVFFSSSKHGVDNNEMCIVPKGQRRQRVPRLNHRVPVERMLTDSTVRHGKLMASLRGFWGATRCVWLGGELVVHEASSTTEITVSGDSVTRASTQWIALLSGVQSTPPHPMQESRR